MSIDSTQDVRGFWSALIGWCLNNTLLVALFAVLLFGLGVIVQPFDSLRDETSSVPRARVAVDAIPDLGENQQIVFTSWAGRSPKDIDDHITYPLTTQLLGLPGVRTVRSSSMFGFSSIYVIFDESVEFYWARARILEKIASLPKDTLPEGASPVLGPDATGLGQVYWYTLEGRDPTSGETVGGWSLHELRSLQDWTVRYALQSTPGVSEVSSVGGHVVEYHVEVDPKKLESYDLSITAVARALAASNQDVGARTMEINRAEYVLRGVGQIENLEDIEQTVIVARDARPIRVGDVARVALGPAPRRGALDLGGAEVVGGVVVARYGENPVAVIESLEEKINALSPSLPQKTLSNGRVSKVTVVPFYNRAQVVKQTLNTLSEALIQQLLITILVVVVLLGNLRASVVISSILPLAVLATFVMMKTTGVVANVMSLAGIAIAIGTMVDMGIVFTENIHERLNDDPGQDPMRAVRAGAAEVAPAVATSVLTTVLSFLPVFGLSGAEGKLFGPLAYTKTFALAAALLLSILLLPTVAYWMLRVAPTGLDASTWGARLRRALGARGHRQDIVCVALGVGLMVWGSVWFGALVALVGGARIAQAVHTKHSRVFQWAPNLLAIGGLLTLLTQAWLPLGAGELWWRQVVFVSGMCLGLLMLFWVFLKVYAPLLRWTLDHKVVFMLLPASMVLMGATVWVGVDRAFSWLPDSVRLNSAVVRVAHALPGLGEEFMPAFDEGQFLYMPTVMPHASIGQALEQLKLMDAAIMQIPEVELAVGKLGRVDSALDPAPVSMFETVISYKPEYGVDAQGVRVRQWREHIKSVDDIWNEITQAAQQPGLTSAPKLMPIQTRIIMLQSGMRAAIGLKIQGPTLEALDQAGRRLEESLRASVHVRPATVFAERVVGKPYLDMHIKREALARWGLSVEDVQRSLSMGLAGEVVTTVTDERARIPLRVRHQRGARGDVDALRALPVSTPSGALVPLSELTELSYVKGPQVIKSEDTFLTSYVTFDHQAGLSTVEAVALIRAHLERAQAQGQLVLPDGVRYAFEGSYKNQLRSAERLSLLVPLALLLIFVVLYLQFRRVSTTLILGGGVVVAISGGFMLMGLYAQPWFMDVTLWTHNLRELFSIEPVYLSVAVWVGFIALVGIATDDGVVMTTYLDQRFKRLPDDARSREAIREAVLDAGLRRVRPCLMTTATTLLALLPVVTSSGRGADIMRPMAIPCIGGMAVELVTLFVVPVLYCAREEWAHRVRQSRAASTPSEP